MKAGWLVAMTLAGVAAPVCAQDNQKPMGTVSVDQAVVFGAPNTSFRMVNGNAELAGYASIKAKPGRNADVELVRGGAILVCQTTSIHMTATHDNALQLAIDRGALEIRSKAVAGDVIVTPDLRFTLAGKGQLDLRMRVTFNGDTCVENKGNKSPALNISDSFGESAYLLKPGQHVMFERGSLKTVMDRETTPCGCPPEEKPGVLIAQGPKGGPLTPKEAAANHPFPTAQSDGLASPPAGEPETPGERHVQVASTLAFDPANPDAAKTADGEPPAAAAEPPAPPPKHHLNPFAAIARFFKRLFAR